MDIQPHDNNREHLKGPITITHVEERQSEVLRWIAGYSGDLPNDGRLVIEAGEKSVGVYRVDGKLYAYLNICMHRGGPVCQGQMLHKIVDVIDKVTKTCSGQKFDKSEPTIVCPWHGFEYFIKTGVHSGDTTIKLKAVPVEEEEGTIYVTV